MSRLPRWGFLTTFEESRAITPHKLLEEIMHALASPTLSPITAVNRGDGRLMSSRASLTAAMIGAALWQVDPAAMGH